MANVCVHNGIPYQLYNVYLRRRWTRGDSVRLRRIGSFCPYHGITPDHAIVDHYHRRAIKHMARLSAKNKRISP